MRALSCVLAVLSVAFVTAPSVRAGPVVQRQDVHVVAPGETLWAISREHGVTPDAIARATGLVSPDRLQVGQSLTIPPTDGIASNVPPLGRHTVQAGDTVWSIARMHRMTPAAVVRLNSLADENRIQLGVILQVTGGPPADLKRRNRVALAVRPAMAWPSRGVVTSRFGPRGRRHHHGIDIGAPIGTPITAARDGVVKFAGWLGGYGALVILDHGAGLTTWYGHASKVLVEVGQRVQDGQLIARVGTTGHVTGPNLHFEVRRNNRPLDPLQFLRGTR